jgi:broad specificity phosphatase PhoE
MKRLLLLLLLSGLFVSAAAAQSTVFLVRHAEKAAGGGTDPNLSDAGRKRAARLAQVLKDAGISRIFVTQFKRTKQTAAPLATRLHLTPISVPAENSAQLNTQLRASSGNVLVVGHSNTISAMIAALGITTSIQIGENDYDNLFVLVRHGTPRLIRLHYP